MHVYVMGIHMLSLKLTFFFNLNFEFKKKNTPNKQTNKNPIYYRWCGTTTQKSAMTVQPLRSSNSMLLGLLFI